MPIHWNARRPNRSPDGGEQRHPATPGVGATPGRTYVCLTCEVEFVIPRSETAVCCPICRMNRIRAID